jgi:hypothetical protein
MASKNSAKYFLDLVNDACSHLILVILHVSLSVIA